jgi:hypothetical protein
MKPRNWQRIPTFNEAWNSFREQVIASDAPPIQISEMRIGFLAGAVWVREQINAIGHPDVDEAQAHYQLGQLHRQIDAEVQRVTSVTPVRS